jgi:hypothetical protein
MLSMKTYRYLSLIACAQLLLKDVPALRELVIIGMDDPNIPDMARSISQLPFTMRVLDVAIGDSPV